MSAAESAHDTRWDEAIINFVVNWARHEAAEANIDIAEAKRRVGGYLAKLAVHLGLTDADFARIVAETSRSSSASSPS